MDGFIWGILAGFAATVMLEWALSSACRCKRCEAKRAFLRRYDAEHSNP